MLESLFMTQHRYFQKQNDDIINSYLDYIHFS